MLTIGLAPEQPERDARCAVGGGGGAQLVGGAVAEVGRQREGDGRDWVAARNLVNPEHLHHQLQLLQHRLAASCKIFSFFNKLSCSL